MHEQRSDSVAPHVSADGLDREVRPSADEVGHAVPTAAVLDRSALIDRLMGDEALAHEILETFIKEVPRQIDTLKLASRGADRELIQRTAHTIKGASANVGAASLKEASGRLEVAAAAAEWDAMESLLRLLESEYGELVGVVRAKRSSGYGDE